MQNKPYGGAAGEKQDRVAPPMATRSRVAVGSHAAREETDIHITSRENTSHDGPIEGICDAGISMIWFFPFGLVVAPPP